MSAYICDKQHIIYLLAAAMSYRLNRESSAMRWYWSDTNERNELRSGDFEKAADVGNMLWRENITSVSTRYRGGSSANLPGPVGEDFVITTKDLSNVANIDPVQVLKSVHCYEYQTCEHDDWKKSEAFAFCDALKSRACRSLVGYDEAAWGAPDKKQATRR